MVLVSTLLWLGLARLAEVVSEEAARDDIKEAPSVPWLPMLPQLLGGALPAIMVGTRDPAPPRLLKAPPLLQEKPLLLLGRDEEAYEVAPSSWAVVP